MASSAEYHETLCRFQALTLCYQSAHWSVTGPTFYEDHLLFGRLYDSASDPIDQIVEYSIGATEDRSVVNLPAEVARVAELVADFPTDGADPDAMFAAAYGAEQDLGMFLTQLIDESPTAAEQDFIGGLASPGLRRCFLLSGRLAGATPAATAAPGPSTAAALGRLGIPRGH